MSITASPQVQIHKRNQFVYRSGRPATHLHRIDSGYALAVHQSDHDNTVPWAHGIYGPGDIVGAPYPVTSHQESLQVLSRLITTRIPNSPTAVTQLNKNLSNAHLLARRYETIATAASWSALPAQEALYKLFHNIIQRHAPNQDPNYDYHLQPIQLTQTQLGLLLRVSRQTVNRALRELEAAGDLRNNQGNYYLRNKTC